MRTVVQRALAVNSARNYAGCSINEFAARELDQDAVDKIVNDGSARVDWAGYDRHYSVGRVLGQTRKKVRRSWTKRRKTIIKRRFPFVRKAENDNDCEDAIYVYREV